MILACHQPQYLAWMGYYHKMAQADVFVYLDRVQYKKREYQNRNRIKSPSGTLWLSIPVRTKGLRGQAVGDVKVDEDRDWRREHWESLIHHYARAPHFQEHAGFFRELYARPWPRLVSLCRELDVYMRDRLSIATPVALESHLKPSGRATERILSLCRLLGADEYLSGAGGRQYLNEAAFLRAGIKLRYQEFRPPVYPQRFGPFVPALSAVDFIFNAGAEAARRRLMEALERGAPGGPARAALLER